MQVSVHEAKTQLSRLLDLIQDGEEASSTVMESRSPASRLYASLTVRRSAQCGASFR